MKTKKRIVILMGAGATVPWLMEKEKRERFKPYKESINPTKHLTDYIIEDFEFKTQTNENFLNFLQRAYAENKNKKGACKKPSDVNFEILLSMIEFLSGYFYWKNNSDEQFDYPQWGFLFEITKEIEVALPEKMIIKEISNTDIEVSFKNNANTFDTSIGYEYSSFFRRMHKHIVDLIEDYIKEYADELKSNENLIKFLSAFTEDNFVTRIYSTNYDNIIKDLEIWDKLNNGFELPNKEEADPVIYNLKSILEDTESNCFYNLHGNIRFEYVGEDSQLNISQKMVYKDKSVKYEYEPNDTTPEDKFLFNPKIVSGQNKIQRTSIEPYRSFFNAFQRDLFKADVILFVGMSFSDEHIKQIIRDAAHFHINNKMKKIKIIFISTKTHLVDQGNGINAINKITDLLGSTHESFGGLRFREKTTSWFDGIYTKNIFSNENPNQIQFQYFSNGFDGFLENEKNWQEIISD